MARRVRAKAVRNPWREYERRKKKLQNQALTVQEYESAVRTLVKQLKL